MKAIIIILITIILLNFIWVLIKYKNKTLADKIKNLQKQSLAKIKEGLKNLIKKIKWHRNK